MMQKVPYYIYTQQNKQKLMSLYPIGNKIKMIILQLNLLIIQMFDYNYNS